MADVQHDFARTSVTPLAQLDLATADTAFKEMESEAVSLLADEGFGRQRRTMTRTVDVRYAGQEHAVTVAFPADDTDVQRAITEDFTRLHERQYGHTMDDPVEVTTFRLRATGTVDKPTLPPLPERTGGGPAPLAARAVYLDEDRPAVDYGLFAREELRAGDAIPGPAVIAEHTATTILHAGDLLRVGRHGELVITVDDQSGAAP